MPASASLRNPTICASVNRFFIVRPFRVGRTLNQIATQNRGDVVKDTLSAAYGHNVHRLFAEARKREELSGHPVVTFKSWALFAKGGKPKYSTTTWRCRSSCGIQRRDSRR